MTRPLLLVLIFFLPLRLSIAQQDAACEWTTCPTPTPTAVAADATSPALPPCLGDDKFFCSGECRDVFGAEYHVCVTKCLAARCTTPPPFNEEKYKTWEKDREERICLEVESPSCERACREKQSTDASKCRMECLKERCPGARRFDRTTESVDPGSVRCRRCRSENEQRCARRCRVLRSDREPLENALSGLACESACYAAACGKECASPL